MKIEIKSWLTKDVIWSYECEGNTIRLTVEAAVKAGVSLNNAQLNDAQLNNAELNYAKLNDAKLNYAQLNYAQLNNAELNNAQLNDAKLNYAQLNYAQLNNAELNNAQLNDAQLNDAELNYAELNNATGNTQRTHCYQHGKYKLVIVGNVCHGGCTTKTLDEWIAYDGAGLDGYELDYLNNVTKPFIRMVKALSGGG
jgi:hypothetical protein